MRFEETGVELVSRPPDEECAAENYRTEETLVNPPYPIRAKLNPPLVFRTFTDWDRGRRYDFMVRIDWAGVDSVL